MSEQRNALPDGENFAWGFVESLPREEGGGERRVPGVIDLGGGKWALCYRLRADDGGVTIHDGRLNIIALEDGETIEGRISVVLQSGVDWVAERLRLKATRDDGKVTVKERKKEASLRVESGYERGDLEVEAPPPNEVEASSLENDDTV